VGLDRFSGASNHEARLLAQRLHIERTVRAYALREAIARALS
jgi:hypothetical protein